MEKGKNFINIMENEEGFAILFGIGIGFLIGANLHKNRTGGGTTIGTGDGIIIGGGTLGGGSGQPITGGGNLSGGGTCSVPTTKMRSSFGF